MSTRTTSSHLLLTLLIAAVGCSEQSRSRVAAGVILALGAACNAVMPTAERATLPIPAQLRDGPLSPSEVLRLPPFTLLPAVREASELFHAGDYEGSRAALMGLRESRGAQPIPPPIAYLWGISAHYADRHEEAIEILQRVRQADALLADHALYFAAASQAKLNRFEAAATMLDAISPSSTQYGRAVELRAQIALAHNPAEAVTLLEAYLESAPSAPGAMWLILASAREKVGSPEAAARSYWDVWAHAPLSAEAKAAEQAVARLVLTLPPEKRRRVRAPSIDQRLTHGRLLYQAHRSPETIKLLGTVLRSTERGGEEWCEAHYLTARSYDKLRDRSKAVPHYDALMRHCRSTPSRVHVLFAGGRSAHQEGLRERALKFFEKLYLEFPDHSYNDDALLRVAAIYRAWERPDDAIRALERALELYPDGDMREEAAWGILWDYYTAGHYTEALAWANRSLALIPRETTFRSAGRTLYWRGRILEHLGRREAANESFRQCMSEYPLTWYSGLAYARLHAHLAPLAERIFTEVVAQDGAPPGPLDQDRPLSVTTQPAFRRGLTFLRLGLNSPAVREFNALSGSIESGEAEAGDWLLAALWELAGQWQRSHNIPRRRRPEFANHYPKGHHERYWRIAYPRPYRSLARQAAGPAMVPEALIHAIMREESGFSPGVESWANAVGLMQLLVPTARDMSDKDDSAITRHSLKDPRLNVRLGARFLGQLYNSYGGRPALAAAGYNAGAGRMRSWLRERGDLEIDEFVERIPFAQTRGYTIRVMESLLRYRYLYGEGPEERGKGRMTLIDLSVRD